MFSILFSLVQANLRGIFRDRILYAVFGVGLFMLLLVPSLSTFSMRQVQELAITLSLSAISLVLLVVVLLLGSSSIWRDIEKRYVISVLTLPISRSCFLVGKFLAISVFLLFCGILLGLCAIGDIWVAGLQFPPDQPVAWGNIFLAAFSIVLKYVLLGSVALLLSSLSTSFFLPFFGTLAIFLAGSASQEVYEYVTGSFGEHMSATSVGFIKAAYYLLPNFSAFDFQVQAVYGLELSARLIGFTLFYWALYTAILLFLAIWSFNRRPLP